MPTAFRSRARGHAKATEEKAEENLGKVMEAVSKGNAVLSHFVVYVSPDDHERLEKIQRIIHFDETGLRGPITQGNLQALSVARRLLGGFSNDKQGAFINSMHTQMVAAKRSAKNFFPRIYLLERNEAQKMKRLTRDINLYITKASHASSASKIQRARYAAGQKLTFARSVDQQYERILKQLDKIDTDNFEWEVASVACAKAKMTIFETAFDKISDTSNKHGVFAAKKFLEGIDETNIDDYGIRVTLMDRAHERSGGTPPPMPGSATMGGTEADKLRQAHNYYDNLKRMPGYSSDKRLEGNVESAFRLISAGDRKEETLIALLGSLNLIWLINTKTVDETRRTDLMLKAQGARTLDVVAEVALESFALYADHYRDQIVDYARSDRSVHLKVEQDMDELAIAIHNEKYSGDTFAEACIDMYGFITSMPSSKLFKKGERKEPAPIILM